MSESITELDVLTERTTDSQVTSTSTQDSQNAKKVPINTSKGLGPYKKAASWPYRCYKGPLTDRSKGFADLLFLRSNTLGKGA